MFFASKHVFANLDVVAARIKESTRSAAFKQNYFNVVTNPEGDSKQGSSVKSPEFRDAGS